MARGRWGHSPKIRGSRKQVARCYDCGGSVEATLCESPMHSVVATQRKDNSMTEQTHTPGPWRIDKRLTDDEDEASYAIIAEDGQYIGCADAVLGSHYDTELNKPNAQLMAAAPDLLDALHRIRDDGNTDGRKHKCSRCIDLADLARAAIEKAG